jgi:gamma-glutamylcyclotransferase (GGCT)/AIG2-like uncharacterized protein YtfP
MSKIITVYGSLKAGRYNHSILIGSTYLGKTEVKGTLYRVSSYPALVNEGENIYEAEVYEVSDEVFDAIYRMEIGAGYELIDTVYYAGEELAKRCKERYEVIDSY